MNKIKHFFNSNFKTILFLLVFTSICAIYNINNQNLNFFFKKGVILEYSLNKNTTIDKKELEKKLISEKIKYSYIEDIKNLQSKAYDSDDILVLNMLHIALPIKADKKQEALFNRISDYIFDTYEGSKLLNIKTLSENYHKPFSSFMKFLGLLFTSFIIWVALLHLISKDENIWALAKENLISYIKSVKEFFKKSREKGFKYFIKRLLFDEAKDEQGNEIEPDTTKEIISTIIFVLVAVILIRYFIGELRYVPTGSMKPTILEKDRVFVEKLDFPKKEIKRGDILVFYPPSEKLKYDVFSVFKRLTGIACKDLAFIKRAIGMPNDKFEIKYDEKNQQYRVYINDKALNEPYIISRHGWTPCNNERVKYCGPFVIPKGKYLMMGDNRGNSEDGRFWGFLDEERIIGRANFMFWPISRINVLTDKYLELHKQKINNEYINQSYIVNRYEFLYKI